MRQNEIFSLEMLSRKEKHPRQNYEMNPLGSVITKLVLTPARTKGIFLARSKTFFGAAAVLVLADLIPQNGQSAGHPLDPLNPNEIRTVRGVIEAAQGLPVFSYFPSITLLEPPKSEVLAFTGGAFSRRALVYAY